MEVFGTLLGIILVVFFAFVVYKAVKKSKSGKVIPGGGGVYPPVVDKFKSIEEATPEPTEHLSPETAVVLPEPTPTPLAKKKPAKKKSPKKGV